MPLIPILLRGFDDLGGDGPVTPPPDFAAVLTVGGVDYDHTARALAGITLGTLRLKLDSYDDLSWKEYACKPIPRFKEGQPVTLTIDGLVRFRGEISHIQRMPGPTGWEYAYQTFGLKRLADYVTVSARDGTGEFCANMPPAYNDPSYIPDLIGLTVGQIVAKVLQVPATAQALDAIGVGGFSGLPDDPILHAETLADLESLNVVPRRGVILSGVGVLNQVEDLIGQWHRRFLLYVRPDDGVIRVFDIKSLPGQSLVVAGDSGEFDPVDWPSYDRSVEGCYSQVRIVGRDIVAVLLTLNRESLVEGWDEDLQDDWTIADFERPRDSYDEGTLSSVTAASATVHSADSGVHWDANFWNQRRGRIYFYNEAISGGGFSDSRQITSCTALTAGGSASITWDATHPLTSTDYTTYVLKAETGPLALVGRKFFVRDPASGDVGLDSYIGAHLVTALPQPVAWGAGLSRTLFSMPIGSVVWSLDGSLPGYNEVTIPLEVNPEDGSVTFARPIVERTATRQQIESGYPATYASGKPTDVRAVVAYNRGGLTAEYPSPGHGGRAHDELDIERTLLIHVDSWQWSGDFQEMVKLARETWESVCDPIEEGSILHHGAPAGWDFLALGYALNLSISGGTESEWDGVDLPVRAVTLHWPEQGPEVRTVTFDFSNRCRAFEGHSLQINPAYGGYDGLDDGFAGGLGAIVAPPPNFGGVAAGLPQFGSLAPGQLGPPPPPRSRPAPKNDLGPAPFKPRDLPEPTRGPGKDWLGKVDGSSASAPQRASAPPPVPTRLPDPSPPRIAEPEKKPDRNWLDRLSSSDFGG